MGFSMEPQSGYKVFDVSKRTEKHLYPFSPTMRKHGIHYVLDEWNYASVGPIMLFSNATDTDLFLRMHQDGCLRAFPVKYIPIQPRTAHFLNLTIRYSLSDIQRFWENSFTEPQCDKVLISPRGTCYAAAICPTFHIACPDVDTEKISFIIARFGEDRI